MYMFTLLFNILSFLFVLTLIAGFLTLLYFIVKKAVKDGTIEANEELRKRDAQRRAE